jgi:hypothetical protein
MDRRCRGVVAVDGCADTAAQLRRIDAEARPRAPVLEGGIASLGGSCNDRGGDAPAAAGDSGSLGVGGSCSGADDMAGRSGPPPSGCFGMPGRSSHLNGTDPGVLNDDEDDSSVDAITPIKWCEL